MLEVLGDVRSNFSCENFWETVSRFSFVSAVKTSLGLTVCGKHKKDAKSKEEKNILNMYDKEK